MNPIREITGAFLRLLEPEQLRAFLILEIRQKEQEGFECASFRERLEACTSTAEMGDLCSELLDARRAREFAYVEPETLADIRRARPDGPRRTAVDLEPAALFDRIHGGWLGRVCGCVLGKPVEPFGDPRKIVSYLKLAGAYPLSNYIPRINPAPEGLWIDPKIDGSCLGELNGAPADDDTDFTLLGLHILESHGADFTTGDVADEWLSHLAYHRTYTAERTTYRNLILGISPAQVARVLNPEREYIGARIRADIYGLACPGNPEQAAEWAMRDASLSHTKNGIYSAMFTAACIAWAFASKDIGEIIRVGLSEIPANCRQAQAIRAVLALHREVDDWRTAYERLGAETARYHPVHAINNTAWMVLAMLYGQGDLEKTICTATLCGFDTDCNAANAGTVAGVLCGAEALPAKWTAPLNDTLRSSAGQFGEMRISELARRTAAVAGTHSSNDIQGGKDEIPSTFTS